MRKQTAVMIAALLLAPLLRSLGAAEAERPNLVLIVIDDLGYGDLGCSGHLAHKTPHIDRLAATGLRFTDFHTNGAMCSPTRIALLTGQYQQRSGVETALEGGLEEGMPLAKITLAEALKPVQYHTGVFGKWHVGHVSRLGPNQQGFDESYVCNNAPDYHSHVSRGGQIDWYRNHELRDEPGYLTDLITEHTTRFIREHRDEPFFVYVPHLAVHFPFQGPHDPAHRTVGKKWNDMKYGPLPSEEYRRAYGEMLAAADDSVEKIVATLDELKLREKTLIFLTSDNGAYSWVGSNGKLRGQKGNLTEGGHRVPAIANWPTKIKPKSQSDSLALTMDVMPTFLSLAGVKPPADLRFDGQNLSGVWLRQESPPPRTIFWRTPGAKAVRRGEWKLVVLDETPRLYDLGNDLAETKNLAEKRPEVVRELLERLDAWERDVAPPG